MMIWKNTFNSDNEYGRYDKKDESPKQISLILIMKD